MSAILTITPNPALDLATTVDHVVAGPKLRCTMPRVDPGGGGVNAARAICKIGGEATALVAVGGATGMRLAALIEAEGVPWLAVAVSGETRQSFAVTEDRTGDQYRFSVPGDVLTPGDKRALLDAIATAAPVDGLVICSGSVAPGLGDDFFLRVQEAIAPHRARYVVDTSGQPLARLLEGPTAPVDLLRLDQKEMEDAAGRSMDDIADNILFARGLVDRGVARMVMSGRGAEGSVLVTAEARFLCRAPLVPVRSKIGAGDSFVGAAALSLSRGDPPETALQWGVAAASAAVGTDGTELCDRQTTEALFRDCVLTRL